MKKIYSILIAIATLAVIAGCSKQAFNDKYYDPSKTTTVTCAKLFTGTMYRGQQYTFNSYWRVYTWDNIFGKLAQTIGFSNNSGSVYYYNDGYAADRWNGFYKTLAQLRVLQNTWENEEDGLQKDRDAMFVYLSEVFVYDQLTQVVDLFGPVPFSKAGYLGITGDLAGSYPVYDDDAEIYSTVLARLDELYTEISELYEANSSYYATTLASQDFLNKGDITKWLKYCNTLMLRLGVHVSAQGSLTSTGKAAVAKAVKRELVSSLDDAIVAIPDYDGFDYDDNFWSGYIDINNDASQPMIDAMQVTGEDDPRLQVIYSPHSDGYYGMSSQETSDEQTERGTYTTHEERYYAHLDSLTFPCNSKLTSPVISAAESYFLQAEAYQQGYASGNAQEAFLQGVLYSVKFYYDLNVNSVQRNHASTGGYQATETPSDAEILEYAQKVWDSYDNKLEAIMTQKWLNFGVLQPTQAWTDIRRTGYPDLYYAQDGQSTNYKTIIQRIMYPNVERSNNTSNYNAAAANVDDNSAYYTLFWAKTLESDE